MEKEIFLNPKNKKWCFFELPEFTISGRNHKFRLGENIGHGGNCTIYQCWDTYDDTEYAVKILMKLSKSNITRFNNEITVLHNMVNNDNSIQIIDFGGISNTIKRKNMNMKDDIPFYIMDRAEFDLEQYLRNKKSLGYITYAYQFIGLANSLSILHNLNVCHRDIKPRNILVTDDGRWLLGDYGLCTMMSNKPGIKENKKIGPGLWLSPEAHNKALGKKDRIDKSSDVYQLATTFWYVVNGRHPTGIITKKEWRLPGKEELFYLLERCLHHRKSARPKDGQEFTELLELALM